MHHLIPDCLPGVAYSAKLKRGIPLVLCQTRIPTAIRDALRAQMRRDGISWRQLFRWAALQYLQARDPAVAERVWKRCV